MRAQSSSSSGASCTSGGSVSSIHREIRDIQIPRSFYPAFTKPGAKGRPQSELMRKKSVELEEQKRSCSLAPHHLFQVLCC